MNVVTMRSRRLQIARLLNKSATSLVLVLVVVAATSSVVLFIVAAAIRLRSHEAVLAVGATVGTAVGHLHLNLKDFVRAARCKGSILAKFDGQYQ